MRYANLASFSVLEIAALLPYTRTSNIVASVNVAPLALGFIYATSGEILTLMDKDDDKLKNVVEFTDKCFGWVSPACLNYVLWCRVGKLHTITEVMIFLPLIPLCLGFVEDQKDNVKKVSDVVVFGTCLMATVAAFKTSCCAGVLAAFAFAGAQLASRVEGDESTLAKNSCYIGATVMLWFVFEYAASKV